MKSLNITEPIFLIGSYRGGTSLILRLLSESKDLWSLYRESDHLWQKYHRHKNEKNDTVRFRKEKDGSFTNLITNQNYQDLNSLREEFDNHYNFSSYDNYCLGFLGRVRLLRDRLPLLFNLMNCGNFIYKKLILKNYRIIDKTPPNMYRIEFIKAIYPDAKFIYIIRDREANIKSLMQAWNHKKAFKHPYRKYLKLNLQIEGYTDPDNVWKFLMPENFENYSQKSLREICEFQYDDAHRAAKEALNKLKPEDRMEIRFEDFMSDPDSSMKTLCDFCNIDYSRKMQKLVQKMPRVNSDKPRVLSNVN